MEANDAVWANNQKLVDTLTPKGKSRTLKKVVDRILEAYPYQRPIEVFKHLSEDEPWFEGCFIISARVDPRLLGELLVRPLAAYEKPVHSPKIRFYLEDGNHRALVYAVSLRLHAEKYQPVRVIYRTYQSWTLLRVRLCLRHASFPLAFHSGVSSSAVRVGYAECVLRVGISLTFYYWLSKRTWPE